MQTSVPRRMRADSAGEPGNRLWTRLNVPRERLLDLLAITAVIGFVFWICAFKIFDADFFWHVTAGRMMRQAGAIITVDPFAYPREGLPYLSNHEWLAQIIFSIVFDAFGAIGIILLRSLLVALACILILLTARKDLWLAAPLVMFTALGMRAGATDRPQLWSWGMVSAFLFASASLLRRPQATLRQILGTTGILVVLQVLWVNLHGGAAVLGVVIGGALAVQLLSDRWRAGMSINEVSVLFILTIPVLLSLALLMSPLGRQNLAYIVSLWNDKSVRLITEWQPREFGLYIGDRWFFWVIALGSIAVFRRNVLFSAIVLLTIGALSRTAYRHEVLFVLVATTIALLQLRDSDLLAFLKRHFRWSLSGAAILAAAVILNGRSRNLAFANKYQAHGYGTVDRAADVCDFLKSHKISGKIFNTYNLGFELIGHLSPQRKVFVDGRTVDFGEEFLTRLYAAGGDVNEWHALEQEYGFTIALVDTKDLEPGEAMPYIVHLEADPTWNLVYLDDHIAGYVKSTPEHQDLIRTARYDILTPETFRSDDALKMASAALEDELRRSVASAPHSIEARILLGRYLIVQGRTADAEPVIHDALKTAPDDYRTYEALGLLRAREGKLDEAERAFDDALALLGREEGEPIRAVAKRIFEYLGEHERAKRYQ